MNPGYMAWYNRITVTYLTQPGIQSTAGMNESASSMRFLIETLQGIWHLTSEHESDPRIRQIREMAGKALHTTEHTDVMDYPTSQRRDVAMSSLPPNPFPHPGRGGVRTGGHGYTRHHRLSQQQPHPEYAVPELLNPENDPPGWSMYPVQESQSQSQWGTTQASCDSFFRGYQFVPPTGEEEEDDEDNDDGGEEKEGEEEDEVVLPQLATEGSSRPTGKSSSSSLIGKAVHKALRGLSTRKNKGKAATKYTPSGK